MSNDNYSMQENFSLFQLDLEYLFRNHLKKVLVIVDHLVTY